MKRLIAVLLVLVGTVSVVFATYDCAGCNGTGEVACRSCGGRGNKMCYACAGKGTVSDSNPNWRMGNSEPMFIQADCSNCDNGRSTCWDCSGNGSRRCSSCNGRGYFND